MNLLLLNVCVNSCFILFSSSHSLIAEMLMEMEGLTLLRSLWSIHLLFPCKITPTLVNIHANLICVFYIPRFRFYIPRFNA